VSFLLDTSVISELVRPAPSEAVLSWLSAVDEDRLYLSVLTIGEIEKGIEKLPPSRRRTSLRKWAREELTGRFEGRLLSIGPAVAQRWGQVTGASEKHGKPLPVIDSLIAATASAHGLVVATRNVADFERCQVECVNPWSAAR
jgi:predicted nucleic acid-binding protein